MNRGVTSRPTSYALHIEPLFTAVDIEHMADFAIDLATYEGVKTSASDILPRLKDPLRPMPPSSQA